MTKQEVIMSEQVSTKVCIVGSGPAAHTAAIYAARAELSPIIFEGWMANGIAAGVEHVSGPHVFPSRFVAASADEPVNLNTRNLPSHRQRYSIFEHIP